MDKSPDAFRSIGEVSRLVGVAPHVLRYWETQFTQLSPVKRGDGRRYYRPDDLRLIAGLCQIMHEEGMSIRGARRLVQADRGANVRRIGAERLSRTQAAVPPPPIDETQAPLTTALTGLPGTTEGWLARLCVTSEALRQLEAGKAALPNGADMLRKRLNSAL